MVRWLLLGIVLFLPNSLFASEIINPYRFAVSGFVGVNGTPGFTNGSLTNGANQVSYGDFVATVTGPAKYLHCYITTTGLQLYHFNGAVYNASGNWIADGALRTGTVGGSTYMTITLDSSVDVVAGTTYRLAYGTSDYTGSISTGQSTASGKTWQGKVSYTVAEAMTDALTATGTLNNNLQLHIYLDNNP